LPGPMIRRLRRSSRLLAPLAACLAALVLVGTVDWWHVTDAEALTPSIHNHDAHRAVFRAQVTPDAPTGEHCYLCHWLRSLQNGFSTSTRHTVADTESRRVQSAAICRTTDTTGSLLPARAPPA
jgi:hypothetical protein